jgi:hypothetical protein
MTFTLPTFNLPVDIYTFGTYPGIPRIVTVGNLSPGRRVSTQYWDWQAANQPGLFMVLLLPAGTDIRGFNDGVGIDTVDCPSGSGRIYAVVMVDDAGKGFPNEHRFALLQQLTPWPTPIP